ncbi:MAG: C4-dicarboxylate ABC transporter [Pusillimonas sp.]|nr:C4-dicarboxylate ABC transporter [Pusillimonas sp.]MBC43043.1 C4-dicarboxylate ABC transporter [Pusillimonas sp.]HCP78238.1 C4-dicarboxylate ABC transporter [Pusillimonas sp.]|tara:strand:- start:5502 stop:6866 length:1365 start_codon:yes stop_codon:yes gene_type:complete
MDIIGNLPLFMFVMLALLMFTGYPVAFVLGGTALTFGLIGFAVDYFALIEFYNITARIWGSVAEKPILVAIPMFIFMGTMLERSGIAIDLLHCLQVLLRRVPGGLAISVTMMGTILAATTGIVGASVIMMTLLALPVMLQRGYQVQLSAGTIAASGTLGILIPPSIMLVILADLLAVSVGSLFMGALFPGLLLAALYMVYIFVLCMIKPKLAPPMGVDEAPADKAALWSLIFRSFIPPVFLIVLVLGSIFLGWATPTEAGGVGAFGAILLAAAKRNLTFPVLKDVLLRSAKTNAMLFMIFLGATAFSYVFRSLGGDDIIAEFFENLGVGPVGVLILMLAVVFVMGFFFDWIEIILIILPVFTPILETMDLGSHVAQSEFLVWFAILLAVNLQTSYLTPPFGYALFYMKGAKIPGVTMQHIYAGIVPFVILQLIGLAIVALFPEIVLWLPRQLGL